MTPYIQHRFEAIQRSYTEFGSRSNERRIIILVSILKGYDVSDPAWADFSFFLPPSLLCNPLPLSLCAAISVFLVFPWRVRSWNEDWPGKASGQLSPCDPFHITIFPPVSTFFI